MAITTLSKFNKTIKIHAFIEGFRWRLLEMGKHYSIVDHTEMINIDLGKGLNSVGHFQFATKEELANALFVKRGNKIEFGDENIDVDEYENMNIKDWTNAT